MEIEKQVVSLKLAKKLKDAGYPMDCYWHWCWVDIPIHQYQLHHNTNEIKDKELPAPTVAELGEKLKSVDGFECHPNPKGWFCSREGNYDGYFNYFQSDTETNTRAEMWLYLKDKGLL